MDLGRWLSWQDLTAGRQGVVLTAPAKVGVDSSVVERFPDKKEVGSSILPPPTLIRL